MVAPIFAIMVVIGIKIKKAGIFIKPTLKGKLVFNSIPEIKNPIHPKTDIKKPIDAALPIALLIVYPTNFNIGTFITAPPIPISDDTKPTINPNTVLCIKLNLILMFVLSLRNIKFRANKYITILKKRTKDFVCIDAAKKLPMITPITTNIP